jgi:3-methyl-2-oxobutanoate hydroxymethyltransferase
MVKGKKTIEYLRNKMATGGKITYTACYDYPLARIAEKAGIDIILLGDSIAMVIEGNDSTVPADFEHMLRCARAVRKGAPTVFLIGDMPYGTYFADIGETIKLAFRYFKEATVDAIKVEGGLNVCPIIRALTNATIPVVGHIGLTPQSALSLGGFKTQGRTAESAKRLVREAREIEKAGAIAIAVECVPMEIGKIIAEGANLPILSTGAGPHCHGQFMNIYDLLGLFEEFRPKFVKRYANLHETAVAAMKEFIAEVESGRYPAEEHNYTMDKGQADLLIEELKRENLI